MQAPFEHTLFTQSPPVMQPLPFGARRTGPPTAVDVALVPVLHLVVARGRGTHPMDADVAAAVGRQLTTLACRTGRARAAAVNIRLVAVSGPVVARRVLRTCRISRTVDEFVQPEHDVARGGWEDRSDHRHHRESSSRVPLPHLYSSVPHCGDMGTSPNIQPARAEIGCGGTLALDALLPTGSRGLEEATPRWRRPFPFFTCRRWRCRPCPSGSQCLHAALAGEVGAVGIELEVGRVSVVVVVSVLRDLVQGTADGEALDCGARRHVGLLRVDRGDDAGDDLAASNEHVEQRVAGPTHRLAIAAVRVGVRTGARNRRPCCHPGRAFAAPGFLPARRR